MPTRIHAIIALFAFAFTGIATQSADAQNMRSRQPLQFPARWLGQGWSAGYHHANPGPNSDYYNPYTAHNSFLLSQQPGYQTAHNQYQGQPLTHGVPYSVYAPTNGAAQQQWNSNQTGAGQSLNPSFVPSDDDADDQADETDTDSAEEEAANEEPMDDIPNITSDPDEPGSIRVDEDAEADRIEDEAQEDADFEESSIDDEATSTALKASYRRTTQPTTNNHALDFGSFMVN